MFGKNLLGEFTIKRVNAGSFDHVGSVSNEADADLIVKAVNNHDRLVKLLREAEEAIHSEYCTRTCHATCRGIQEALADLEAKP